MKQLEQHYIDGRWVDSRGTSQHEIASPFSEQTICRVHCASELDAEDAIQAAHRALPAWKATPSKEREDLILAIAAQMKVRRDDLIDAIHQTLGCPKDMVGRLQVDGPTWAMQDYAQRAHVMETVEQAAHSKIFKEAVGVCSFINPWNYPLHQFVGKVAPALAAGCTMVVKPAEQTPLQDIVMAEIFNTVGLPAGVFNLVLGKGSEIGPILTSHPLVNMVSFTGSTRAGIQIARSAADSVKRVVQELGGKSPYLITADADLEKAVTYGVKDVMINSGQTCTALTRMLVPRDLHDKAIDIAKKVAESLTIDEQSGFLGPVVNASQHANVLSYIQAGLDEGAQLVTGGLEKPAGKTIGYYIKPTIFAGVHNQMRIAREEIFGPVLSILPYDSLEEAIQIANDTPYGLSSGVYAKDEQSATQLARQIEAGLCFIQGADFNYQAPFGGCKQSGNGREFGGNEGLKEFYELKSVQMG